MVLPGGGGYGDPLDRDPERVAEDVRTEMVSPEAALHDYGVVLEPETGQVDPAATVRERARRKPSAPLSDGVDPGRPPWRPSGARRSGAVVTNTPSSPTMGGAMTSCSFCQGRP